MKLFCVSWVVAVLVEVAIKGCQCRNVGGNAIAIVWKKECCGV